MASLPCITPHIYVFFLLATCIIIANPWPRTAADDSFKNRLRNDNISLTEASNDYGNIVHNVSAYVLEPLSVKDIIDLIRSPPTKTIAARGNGHSLRGQAMALGGVVVNMTAMKGPGRIKIGWSKWSGYYVDVGAEQQWIDVLRATLKYGVAPVSWTDYLYATVGGTLSNAGIGGQTFARGPQISNVLQLEVVTGKGEFIACSRNTSSELFYGALGGLGQFGIIDKARIILNKAPTRVKWAWLIYGDFKLFTKDQEYLISSNVASYVEGFLILNASTITSQWSSNFNISVFQQYKIAQLLKNQSILYSIELTKYYDNHTASTIDEEFERLQKGLNFIKGLNFTRDAPFFDFLHRVGNLDTPERGSLLSHPWLNLFMPKSNISEFNKHVLVGMLPRLKQTLGIYILYPLYKRRWDYRMTAVTPELEAADKDVIYTLGLLHTAKRDEFRMFDAFNNEVLDVCKNANIKVKLYLANYKKQEEWKTHFGFQKWTAISNMKDKFDPKHMLSPGQGIFN